MHARFRVFLNITNERSQVSQSLSFIHLEPLHYTLRYAIILSRYLHCQCQLPQSLLVHAWPKRLQRREELSILD